MLSFGATPHRLVYLSFGRHVESLAFRVQRSTFRVQNSKLKVQGSKFKVQSSKFGLGMKSCLVKAK